MTIQITVNSSDAAKVATRYLEWRREEIKATKEKIINDAIETSKNSFWRKLFGLGPITREEAIVQEAVDLAWANEAGWGWRDKAKTLQKFTNVDLRIVLSGGYAEWYASNIHRLQDEEVVPQHSDAP